MIIQNENTIVFEEDFYNPHISVLFEKINEFKNSKKDKIRLDFSRTLHFDTLAIATFMYLEKDEKIEIIFSSEIKKELLEFKKHIAFDEKNPHDLPRFDSIVITVLNFFSQFKSFIILSADVFYYSFRSLFNWDGRKKGSVFEQIHLMGNNAVPIVSLLSFLIGLILSLQSAAQLRQFGANIYLVDLIVIAMITEMGPMITAVIVAGRSGSAIAAEISTMKITEELDALQVMALNPLKYVVAPKMLAMSVSLPVLTILSNLVGIFGGFIIAILYLDLSPDIFFNRAVEVMTLPFWRQSVLKSILFSWIIVLIGAHFGFNVKGGAEGVGKATTASVVASIFAVIMTDAILSLIFYFEF
ncbi:MAG: ABC transporter permease [Candidatus Delongbacteria bacterium]|nr:ABC transporter permease [Candidatus Delongbacteria bacterium]MCG2759734.1 ABC transporter permease [Candidatus Delongbacteria bacterium]